MEVLLAERTSDEENQETSVVISICQNAGKKLSSISIFAYSQLCLSGIGIRHQDQSSTAGLGLVRHCPAMVISLTEWNRSFAFFSSSFLFYGAC
jgi:hypothetical protein